VLISSMASLLGGKRVEPAAADAIVKMAAQPRPESAGQVEAPAIRSSLAGQTRLQPILRKFVVVLHERMAKTQEMQSRNDYAGSRSLPIGSKVLPVPWGTTRFGAGHSARNRSQGCRWRAGGATVERIAAHVAAGRRAARNNRGRLRAPEPAES